MAYVTLDSNNNVTGVFTMPQPQLAGYAVIADDDLRIATFQQSLTATLAPVPTLGSLQAQLNVIQTQIKALTPT